MIHTSLPLKPRIDSPLETIITPLSVFSYKPTSILSLTGINTDIAHCTEYFSLLEKKLGIFDKNFIDNDMLFLQKIPEYISRVNVVQDSENMITCECGKFEELPHIRMYNQRRVQDGNCTYCNSALFEKQTDVLKISASRELHIESHNKPWVMSDLIQFKKRQHDVVYRITKNSEPIRFLHGNKNYGIKHQFVWACGLAYICESYNTDQIGIHFVHKTANIVFMCASLLKTIRPDIKIHLFGLPTVWLDTKKNLTETTPHDIYRIRKGMNSKRKDLKI